MTIMNSYVPYVNADTLAVKYPDLLKESGRGGEIGGVHTTQILEVDIDYTDLTTNVSAAPDSATEVVILDWNLYIPAGATIEKIEVATTTAWTSAGDGFKLNVGLVKKSDMSTIVDSDGLIDSLPELSNLDSPNTLLLIDNLQHTTGLGALLNDAAPIAFDSVLCTWWETEAPTAGVSKVRVFYRYTS